METSNILTIIEIFVLVLSICISTYLIILKINKNRNLETIKYVSMVRTEIWEITNYQKIKDFKEEHISNDKQNTEKLRALKQKLEYMAAAINNDDLSVDLLKSFCGKWFQAAVRILGIVEVKKTDPNGDSYEEIKRLYTTLDESYNKN